MANHKSAAKRARQEIKRTARNGRIKSTIRTFEKKLRAAITQKDKGTAENLLVTFTSQVDKAATKGIFHARTAARKISRISTQVNGIK